MEALLIAAGITTLSSTAMATKLDERIPYPRADADFTRQVIHLPKQDAEDAFRVKIVAGKTLEADCSQQHLGGELEEHILKGWGCSYYRLGKVSRPMSTMTAYPGQKREQRFILVIGEGSLLCYNSKLPIVVYAPGGMEVRYWIQSATEKVKKAVSE